MRTDGVSGTRSRSICSASMIHFRNSNAASGFFESLEICTDQPPLVAWPPGIAATSHLPTISDAFGVAEEIAVLVLVKRTIAALPA